MRPEAAQSSFKGCAFGRGNLQFIASDITSSFKSTHSGFPFGRAQCRGHPPHLLILPVKPYTQLRDIYPARTRTPTPALAARSLEEGLGTVGIEGERVIERIKGNGGA